MSETDSRGEAPAEGGLTIPKPPRFQTGQAVRHSLYGAATVAGSLQDGPTWLYDLSPGLDGGEVQMEGKWFTPEFMLYPMENRAPNDPEEGNPR